MSLDPRNFEHMIGTERTEVRKLHRDDAGEWVTVELRYRVEGVKFKGASRWTEPTVTVWGRCVDFPEGSLNPNGGTWHGAYCAEIFSSDPEAEPEQEQAPEDAALAEAWAAEQAWQAADYRAHYGRTFADRDRGKRDAAEAHTKLHSLLDAMSSGQRVAYRKYRSAKYRSGSV